MINHARNLLLNSAARQPDVPGEEFIPADFVPIPTAQLPNSVIEVRRRLFGANPDQFAMNFRLFQLLQLLHATPFGVFVKLLDTRLTYDKFDRTDLLGGTSTNLISIRPVNNALVDVWALQAINGGQQKSNPLMELTVSGEIPAPDASGVSHFQWTAFTSTSVPPIFGVQTRHVWALRTLPTQVGPWTGPLFKSNVGSLYERGHTQLVGQLSPLLELPGSSLSWRIRDLRANMATNPYTVPPGGNNPPFSTWVIDVFAKPQRTIKQLEEDLRSTDESVRQDLFTCPRFQGIARVAKNLWETHPELPYRMAGLLIALIFKTEEARLGQVS